MNAAKAIQTPDGRYVVVRDRLWRAANPNLPEELRQSLVRDLMLARRAVKDSLQSNDARRLASARAAVNAAKIALGERGPAWWNAADEFHRHLVVNTPYAAWYRNLKKSGTTVR